LEASFLCFSFRYHFCVSEFDSFSLVTLISGDLFAVDELKSHGACILMAGLLHFLALTRPVYMLRSMIATLAEVVLNTIIIIIIIINVVVITITTPTPTATTTSLVHHHLSHLCKIIQKMRVAGTRRKKETDEKEE
jgi:hypothetical protein